MKLFILSVIAIIAGGLMLTSCSSLGTRPNKVEVKELAKSPNYDSKKGKFVNRLPDLMEEMRAKMSTLSLLKDWLKGGDDRTPNHKLPEVKPDIEFFLAPSKKAKIIWFGHSTFLLNIEGKIVLVDPVFSNAASPVSFMVKRFQAPVLKLDELPEVDYILISHDHYDHLDMESIKFFKDKNTKFITPLGVGSHITGWGISKERIVEKDWWHSVEFDGVKFTATPAQHFSGRDGIHNDETLWASWVIKSENNNIYLSGDSGYDVHFKEIGEKLGPFDMAFIESGQYDKKWQEVHMLPEEAAQAYFDLKAKAYFPIHWGMFELAMHPWYEPIQKIEGLSREKGIKLVAPIIGQLVELDKEHKQVRWWDAITAKKISYNQAYAQ